MANRPFAASRSRGTKPPCRRPKVALGQDEQRKLHLKSCMPLSFVGLVPVRLLLSSMAVCTMLMASCKGPIAEQCVPGPLTIPEAIAGRISPPFPFCF